MINKRKPFFLKENLNLKFIACFAAAIMAGTTAAAFLIYNRFQDILEKTAFSSHLSLSSSGELFRDIVFKVNFWVAVISIILGLCMIMMTHYFLENFFRHLNSGLNQLARGDFSFRLSEKFHPIGGFLFEDFNLMAGVMDKKAKEIIATLDAAQKNLQSESPIMLEKTKLIHKKLLEMDRP